MACSRRTTSLAAVQTRVADYEHSEPFRSSTTDSHAQGTAFLVDFGEPSIGQVILTNAHCVEDAANNSAAITLSFEHCGGPSAVPATVRHICPELDFACISCAGAEELMEPMVPLVQWAHDPEEGGLQARVQGFPLGDASTVRTANGCWGGSHEHYVQLSASINGGNSGGPISLRGGEHDGFVFAIATASIAGAEGVALGVPLYHVHAVLKHVVASLSEPRCLVRVPRLHSLRAVPLSDVERIDNGAVAGARVLQPFGPLRAGDIITRVNSFSITCDTAKLSIPHAFCGADLHSLEVALALLPGPARMRVRRKGVADEVEVRVPLLVQTPPRALYPRWDPGLMHYCMFGQQLCFVQKSLGLLREFNQNMMDPFCVAAWAAPSDAIVLTWVEPGSEAERVGMEPLMLLHSIDGEPTHTPDLLTKFARRVPRCKRKRRRPQSVEFNFQSPNDKNLLTFCVSAHDFTVHMT